MKILQICFRMPYPLKDGGAIAMYNMTMGFLDAGCELTLFIPSTKKHALLVEELPEQLREKARLIAVPLSTEITFWGAFINLFTRKSYYISRYESSYFRKQLKHLLLQNHFDIIQVESIKMSMYIREIRKYSKAKAILRSHNIEHLIWERMAQSTASGIKKFYLKLLAKRLRRYEMEISRKYDALVAITSVDADYFLDNLYNRNVYAAPSGVIFTGAEEIKKADEPYSLFHIGAMDWMPNLEAIDWFLEKVWPLIAGKFPDLKFYLAGRNMPGRIKDITLPNVIVLGEVEDAETFMASKGIMVVPLLSGSGMRIKVAEGMALGKVIISTSVGAEGIPCTDGKDILIADKAEDFLMQLEKLLPEPHYAENIGREARKTAMEKLDNKSIISGLLDYYNTL